MMVPGLKTACSSQALHCYYDDRSHSLVLFLLPGKILLQPFQKEQHFFLLTYQCDTLCVYICKCSVSLSPGTEHPNPNTHIVLLWGNSFLCNKSLLAQCPRSLLLQQLFLKEDFLSCFRKVFCYLCEMRNFYTNHSQQDSVPYTFHIQLCIW